MSIRESTRTDTEGIDKKPKADHGAGTINERNGRFQAQVLVKGRRVSKTFPTRTEAKKWIRQTLANADQGLLPANDGKVTLEQFLSKWLEMTTPSIRPKTIEQYEGMIRLHINPTLGKVRLAALRADHLQSLYGERLTSGLSARTVQIIHMVLHHALKDAVRWGRLPRNVADATTPPKPKRREMAVWTQEQARLFLDGVRGDRYDALYVLALSCGLRAGELLGLKWEDVDLDRGRIQVQRTIQRVGKGNGLTEGEPKTARGRRQIVLPESAREALRRWKVRQLEDQMLHRTRWQQTGYVFTSTVGTATEPRRLKTDFAAHVKRLGLPPLNFHGLRHTCATTLLSRGVHPRVVQELLGHSSISLTLDTYSHVLPTLHEEAATIMERALGAS